MSKFPLVPLTDMADIHDYLREPISQTERNKREGAYPYFGATGQVGWIDGYRQDGRYVLLGEDGAPFLDSQKSKAYIVEGKCWVNNHAHVLKGKPDVCDDDFLCFALNWADYSESVTGSTRLKLPQNMMNRLLIPKPRIEKQRQIAARLKAQLAFVETARQAAQVQLRDTRLLRNRVIAETFDGIDIEPSVLGDVIRDIQAGKSFQTSEILAQPNELGVLKVSAVSWSNFRPDQAKALNGDYEPGSHHRVCTGDFIISRANTKELVGAVVLVDKDYPNRLLSDKTLRLVIDETQASKEYLLYALRAPLARKHIEHFATGTSDSMRNISQGVITSIPVVLPSLLEQEQIVAKLKKILTEINALENSSKAALEDINRLPNRVLAQAFNQQGDDHE